MATKAFILIETAVGKTREVADVLNSVGGMQSVNVVTGPYDVIAVIDTPDINVMGSLVTEKIHTISGVVRTVTCVAVGS
ncbi:MAG: Lrp/AsnC ligand binding domain-containing protein [Dehalococcoidia bacterium]|nr:Lrp/AsnC ligand binding domain-containing protein [Dehalococcoidia bacterium]